MAYEARKPGLVSLRGHAWDGGFAVLDARHAQTVHVRHSANIKPMQHDENHPRRGGLNKTITIIVAKPYGGEDLSPKVIWIHLAFRWRHFVNIHGLVQK